MYFLYSLCVTLVLLLGLPFWLVQMARKGKYRAGLSERFGRISARLRPTAAHEDCIWIHAVSVGEVLAVTGLIAAFKRKFPGWRVAVSTTTATGQALARARFGDENVFYVPLDLRRFIRPYFRHLRPRALVLAESEFWPNLLWVAQDSQCRSAVVNARVSDRSFPSYLRFANLLRKYALSKLDLLLAQAESDGSRLVAMGAPAHRVQVTGNLKFDFTPPQESDLVRSLRSHIGTSRLLVCGSTVAGEEAVMLPALQEIAASGAVILLAPRHPERFDPVAKRLIEAGLPVIRRSQWQNSPIAPGSVFLLDTIGELASVYALADVAFVGGSLVHSGGHNVLEPAYFGKATLVGPHMENFRDIANRLTERGGLVRVTVDDFAQQVLALLDDQTRRDRIGSAARQVVEANSGATATTLTALETLLWMPSSLRAQMTEPARSAQ
jgi:3-deoxy-D-manno-octulosonic-acid transferase